VLTSWHVVWFGIGGCMSFGAGGSSWEGGSNARSTFMGESLDDLNVRWHAESQVMESCQGKIFCKLLHRRPNTDFEFAACSVHFICVSAENSGM